MPASSSLRGRRTRVVLCLAALVAIAATGRAGAADKKPIALPGVETRAFRLHPSPAPPQQLGLKFGGTPVAFCGPMADLRSGFPPVQCLDTVAPTFEAPAFTGLDFEYPARGPNAVYVVGGQVLVRDALNALALGPGFYVTSAGLQIRF